MNAYIIKALFNWPKPKYLTDNCRLVILRQDIVRIETGMEILNPLNSLEILSQNRKLEDMQDSKIAYSLNGF